MSFRLRCVFVVASLLPSLATAADGDLKTAMQQFAEAFQSGQDGAPKGLGEGFTNTLQSQNAPFTVEDLKSIHVTTRDSIRNGKIEVSVTRKLKGRGETGGKFLLAFDGNNRLCKISRTSDPSLVLADNVSSVVRTYDGSIVRQYEEFTDRVPYAGVVHFESFQSFLPADADLLAKSMICDSEEKYGARNSNIDLEEFLSMGVTIFDEVFQINGYPCYAVSDMGFVAYVCPDINFGVVKLIRHEVADEGVIPSVIRTCSDFAETAPGVFLPNKVVELQYAGGEQKSELVLTVDSVQINQEIDQTEFTGAIPVGTMVSNTVRGLMYVQAREGSIGGVLDDVIEPIANRNGRFWFLAFSSAVIGLMIVILSRRALRPQKTVEAGGT